MQARLWWAFGWLSVCCLSPSVMRAQSLPDAGAPAPEPVSAQPAPATAAPAETGASQVPAAPATPAETPAAVPPAPTAAPIAPVPAAQGGESAPAAAPQPASAVPPATATLAAEAARPVPAASMPAAEPGAVAEEYDAKQLYLRLGAGFGFPFGPDVADRYDDRAGNALHFSGYGLALDMMAGAALMRGLVIGGGATSDMIAGGTVRTSDQAHRDLEHGLYYAVIGGFADYYTSPPAGLHLQALLGVARLSLATDLGHNAAYGFGAVLGLGYEWAAGRRWNLGALARVALSPLGMPSVAHQKPSPTLYEPSLLWTATFRPE